VDIGTVICRYLLLCQMRETKAADGFYSVAAAVDLPRRTEAASAPSDG
jgi:hypothetical protein